MGSIDNANVTLLQQKKTPDCSGTFVSVQHCVIVFPPTRGIEPIIGAASGPRTRGGEPRRIGPYPALVRAFPAHAGEPDKCLMLCRHSGVFAAGALRGWEC